MFVFSRVKYRVLIVRHMIYDHHCLWSCLPELHTMSLLFDISSMIFIFYVCVFQRSIVCPYCTTFHLWSPLLMFMSSRDNITSLMFDVSSIITAIHVCNSSSSRTDRWAHFQQNAGLWLFVHTWIVRGIDDCYHLTRTFGGFSGHCLSKLFMKEFTVLLLTTSLGSAFQVVAILIG